MVWPIWRTCFYSKLTNFYRIFVAGTYFTASYFIIKDFEFSIWVLNCSLVYIVFNIFIFLLEFIFRVISQLLTGCRLCCRVKIGDSEIDPVTTDTHKLIYSAKSIDV